VIQKIFEKGSIEGITDHQLLNFVKSRVNVCLQQLGYGKLYEVSYNPIAKWFYKNINTVQFHDFFTGVGNSYNRDWDETKFVF
jgi:ribonucleotide reductase beta subunit family protein with ferritin-like domain